MLLFPYVPILHYFPGHLEWRFAHQPTSPTQGPESSTTGLCVTDLPKAQGPGKKWNACVPSSVLTFGKMSYAPAVKGTVLGTQRCEKWQRAREHLDSAWEVQADDEQWEDGSPVLVMSLWARDRERSYSFVN